MIPETPAAGFFASTYTRKKFKDRTESELLLLWDGAYSWVCKHVDGAHLDPEPHPLLIAAMFLYMQHVCEQDARAKAAYLFSAHELLAVFPPYC